MRNDLQVSRTAPENNILRKMLYRLRTTQVHGRRLSYRGYVLTDTHGIQVFRKTLLMGIGAALESYSHFSANTSILYCTFENN